VDKRLDEIEWTGTSDNTIKRIMSEGIETVEQLLQYTTKELAEKIHSQESTVDKVIEQAIREYGLAFETGAEVLEAQKQEWVLSTGSVEFDRILGGGIRSRGVTELIGEYSSGKSQACFTAAVIGTQVPPNEEGEPPKVVLIDNEHTFSPHRIIEIARTRGYNPDMVLNRLLVKEANTSAHQEKLIDVLDYVMKKNYVVLIIIDGMISHLRNEYLGRGSLSERQQKLNKMLGKLLSISVSHNIPLLVTNQVQAKVDGRGFGDPNQPAGGHIMAHANKCRVRLWKGREHTKLVSVIDSSFLPEEKTRIAVSKAGIVDEDGTFPDYVIGTKIDFTLEEPSDES